MPVGGVFQSITSGTAKVVSNYGRILFAIMSISDQGYLIVEKGINGDFH